MFTNLLESQPLSKKDLSRNNSPRFQFKWLQWHLKVSKRQKEKERKKEETKKENKQIQYTNRKQKEREPALAVSIK